MRDRNDSAVCCLQSMPRLLPEARNERAGQYLSRPLWCAVIRWPAEIIRAKLPETAKSRIRRIPRELFRDTGGGAPDI